MSDLTLKSVYDLLGKNFFIPSYQRGYRWGKRQVQDLLEDLYRFRELKKKPEGSFYCLQPIVVKKCDEQTKCSNKLQSDLDNNTWYEVVDGQQRLTSIYLLLKYITDTDKSDMKEDYGRELFKLHYETRHYSTSFIKEPSQIDNSSPNASYITEGYNCIADWFNTLPVSKGRYQVKPIRDKFITLLTNTKDSADSNEGYVQVIWYETDDPDPIKTFTRLNIGKIPLENSELIKALFLQKRDETERSDIQQIQIAKEWDQIEAQLQNKRIWAFLNEGLPDTPTHIDFIFDAIYKIKQYQKGSDEFKKRNGRQPDLKLTSDKNETEKLGRKLFADRCGSDKYATFRFFSDLFDGHDRETIENEWSIVRHYFGTFMEWYDNPLWYHYVGFLLYIGEPIVDIYNLYNDKTKKEFEESLVSIIKKNLNVRLKTYGEGKSDKDIECKNKPIVYGNEKLKHLLVLYNIEYIIQQNTGSNNIYIRFPFDLFKSEKWDIEHVDSYTTNPLNNEKQLKEWLKTNIETLVYYGIISSDKETFSESEREKLSADDRKKLKEFREHPDLSNKTDKLKEIKKIVLKLAGEYLENDPDEEVKNKIGNLTLLNKDINRGYGNAIFPSKKKEISRRDAEGRFIPICTKNVFLKNFIGNYNPSPYWSENDMELYRMDIIRVLDKFLIQSNED